MINTTRLRCTIGWLGMLLPWIVVLLIGYIPQSISATWYTNACTPFMIILGSSCILLISYKGYEKIDDIITTLTAIFGLGICLFPCYPSPSVNNFVPGLNTPFMVSYNISNTVHLICAFVFFALLAVNSFFLFTKSGGDMTPEKKKRNIIYRVCGVGMLVSFALLLLPYFYIKVWLVETIALLFFGVSWLTKADYYPWLFADKK
jgi:hypothetical protein